MHVWGFLVSIDNPQNSSLVTWLLMWNNTLGVKYSIKKIGWVKDVNLFKVHTSFIKEFIEKFEPKDIMFKLFITLNRNIAL